MPNKVDWLSARNLIMLSAAVLVISLATTALSSLGPNDSGGWGRDSFGTRADGYRAVYELLEELGTPVVRDAAPPRAEMPISSTLVMLGPDPGLVRTNSTYLRSLLPWIRRGGRLVVAAELEKPDSSPRRRRRLVADDVDPQNVLTALGLEKELKLISRVETEDDSGLFDVEAGRPSSQVVRVKALPEGADKTSLGSEVTRLAIPEGQAAALDAKPADLAWRLTSVDADGVERMVAVGVKQGAGEIVVVAEPAIFDNVRLAQADNSVLAVRLLWPAGSDVVFDEFYHGLSVRGNPLYLLTLPGFAAVTFAILLVIAASTWRAANFLGPSLPDVDPSRRSIGEYASAMGHFFSRAPDSPAFLLRETRDGVLRELCRAMRMPVETPDATAIAAALERRDPRRADRLRLALAEADSVLAAPGRRDSSSFLSTIQRLVRCL